MLSKLRNTREFKTRLKLLFYSLDNERYPIFTDTLIFLNFIVKKKNFHLHPKKIRGRNCLLAFETRGLPLINQIIWISNRDKSEIGQVSYFRLTHFFFRRMHAIFFPPTGLFLLKLLRNYFSRCDLHCFTTCNFMYLDDTQQWRNAKPKDPSALVSLLFSQPAFKCLFFCRSLSLSSKLAGKNV